jgi:hypothetical protein
MSYSDVLGTLRIMVKDEWMGFTGSGISLVWYSVFGFRFQLGCNLRWCDTRYKDSLFTRNNKGPLNLQYS